MNDNIKAGSQNVTDSAVYVDAPVWPYRGMLMWHMFANRVEDLHAMADRIGVQRRWFQNKPGFPHYDICKSKRSLAVSAGAVEVDRKQFVAVVERLRQSSNVTRSATAQENKQCAT